MKSMMSLGATLFTLSFWGQPVWADCYERYYTPEHLQTYPRQVVRSVILDMERQYEDPGKTYQARLQIHVRLEGQDQLLQLQAYCQGEEVTLCQDLQGSGQFEVKWEYNEDQWPYDRSALLKIKANTPFANITRKSKLSPTYEIPEWDRTLRVHANPMAESFSGRCEPEIQQAHRVSPYRLWNEINLLSVRHDLARPTITARNLYHLSLLLTDMASVFSQAPSRLSLGQTLPTGLDERGLEIAQHYAAYTFLKARYALAPGNAGDRFPEYGDEQPDHYIDHVLHRALLRLGLQEDILKLNPEEQNFAHLGIEVAEAFLADRLEDGSREAHQYTPGAPLQLINPDLLDTAQSGLRRGIDYQSVIESFFATSPDGIYSSEVFDVEPHLGPPMNGTFVIDHWARLNVPSAVDQSGNPQPSEQKPLTPHWGLVETFSDLTDKASSNQAGVFFPELLSLPRFDQPDEREAMIRANLDVVIKSSLLNPLDMSAFDFDGDGKPDSNPGSELMDISPASLGNNPFATNLGQGYPVNPVTQKPYEPQWVLRADYYRALAEYWADGPESETPPGHWNLIANYVVDRMEELGLPFRWLGQGEVLSREEFERRLYLTLNGALHDAGVVAWGIKAHYQGNRPVTVLRQLAYMAEQNPDFAQKLVSLAPDHVRMFTYTKLVQKPNQPETTHIVTKMAIKSWRGYSSGEFFGPDSGMIEFRDLSFQTRDQTAQAEQDFFWEQGVRGVGWILADNWLPYQRSSFVTPPFPGFISGHSTFSRAAAEVLAGVTGSTFFPGGLGRIPAPPLHFEQGPAAPFDFQWAQYYDAADESGQSRIYGGIHASYDDIPGRKIGSEIGRKALETAKTLFSSSPAP